MLIGASPKKGVARLQRLKHDKIEQKGILNSDLTAGFHNLKITDKKETTENRIWLSQYKHS